MHGKIAKIIVKGAGERQSEADTTAEVAKGSGMPRPYIRFVPQVPIILHSEAMPVPGVSTVTFLGTVSPSLTAVDVVVCVRAEGIHVKDRALGTSFVLCACCSWCQ